MSYRNLLNRGILLTLFSLDYFDTFVIVFRTGDCTMDQPTDAILAATWLVAHARIAPDEPAYCLLVVFMMMIDVDVIERWMLVRNASENSEGTIQPFISGLPVDA